MDLKIIETGSGGDVVFENGDLVLGSEVYNQPYLAHFGGNKEGISDEYIEGKPRNDFWGNTIIQDKECFDSRFERALTQNEISSSGIKKIEQAAIDDMAYLEGFAETESTVVSKTIDRVDLHDKISSQNNVEFSYIWNEAKDEVIE